LPVAAIPGYHGRYAQGESGRRRGVELGDARERRLACVLKWKVQGPPPRDPKRSQAQLAAWQGALVASWTLSSRVVSGKTLGNRSLKR
jgi:hypothetical protein